uniref:CCHC-type domain-containing protein n=1 Tax=Solanum tuberosum TaxID=4113 RepID=M1DSB0_SOLTU
MNTRGRPARRVGEENVNEGLPPQGPQDNQVSVEVPDMTNEEIRSAFLTLARAMKAQETRDVGPRVNVNEGTITSKLRDFVRMNPLVFLGSKRHYGKCLADTNGCYGCGKNYHKVKDCPTLTARVREVKQASLSGPNLDGPKRNRFYALQASKDKEANPDEGTGAVLTFLYCIKLIDVELMLPPMEYALY